MGLAEYDYIIVGAGSAGCVLANRLSADPASTVLLIEAGPPDNRREIPIPAAWVSLFKSPLDWNYETDPEEGLGGRSIYWPRGKTLGGSSSTNAQIYLRGHRLDFDEWSAAGNRGWSYTEVLPYFKRAENFAGGADMYHGSGGPLCVSSPEQCNPLSQAFLESGLAVGLPRNDDFNAAEMDGIGLSQFTRRRGRRWSTATGYLKPARRRKNLHVWTQTHVLKVLLDRRTAAGVLCTRGRQTAEVRARREVILCGGAVNTPALLMHSGIGEPAELQAHGIPVRHALPGVGRNLQDHPIAPLLYLTPEPVSLLSAKSIGNLARFLVFGRGMLACSGVDVLAHARTHSSAPAPDLQLLLMAVLWQDQGLTEPKQHGFTIAAAAMKPRSRGTVTLRSGDPTMAPRIRPGYCTDPDGEDIRVLADGLRLGRSIVAAAPFARLRGEEVAPGSRAQTNDELRNHVRQTAQGYYHAVGTCRMGSDENAVVDPELRVRGLERLRVADASVMPTIPRANTNAATIMIGEKAADLVRASG